MYQFLIALCFSTFIFCAAIGLLTYAYRGPIEIKNRVKQMQGHSEVREKKNKNKIKGVKSKRFQLAFTERILSKLENELFDVGVKISPSSFLLIWICAALVLPALFIFGAGEVLFGLGFAAVSCAAPIVFVRVRKSVRREKLEAQLTDAITLLCNALRAGHSFQMAMNNIAMDMDAPISEEFGRMFRETLHGMSLEESMRRMVDRIESDDLDMLCTAIIIQKEIGGNLAEILENISDTIQRRLALKTEVKTRTSSGRLSGYIIGALPILLLVVMSLINPEYSSAMFTEPLGQIMLLAGAVMEIIGFIVIRKIIAIKY